MHKTWGIATTGRETSSSVTIGAATIPTAAVFSRTWRTMSADEAPVHSARGKVATVSSRHSLTQAAGKDRGIHT